MDPMYDLHSWSKQRREEAVTEAQRRSLTKRAKRNRGTRFVLGRLGLKWCAEPDQVAYSGSRLMRVVGR